MVFIVLGHKGISTEKWGRLLFVTKRHFSDHTWSPEETRGCGALGENLAFLSHSVSVRRKALSLSSVNGTQVGLWCLWQRPQSLSWQCKFYPSHHLCNPWSTQKENGILVWSDMSLWMAIIWKFPLSLNCYCSPWEGMKFEWQKCTWRWWQGPGGNVPRSRGEPGSLSLFISSQCFISHAGLRPGLLNKKKKDFKTWLFIKAY